MSQEAASTWFRVQNEHEVESPALLVYPDRIEENIRRMVSIAGGPERLRPHVKTHKLADIVQRKLAAGISKFKAATISEMEMLGRAGVADALLAYQPVGPNRNRILDLIEAFPKMRISCLLDDVQAAQDLSESAIRRGTRIAVLLDVDCGQNRTGVPAGGAALELYKQLCGLPGLKPVGLHAYDGHNNQADPAERKSECDRAFEPVLRFRQRLLDLGLPASALIAGGTPTFPIHALRSDVECSPGTCVLWDFGYGDKLKDLDFLHAALVLTRVISKPGPGRLCLDLGHKAIAAENPHPRVQFLNDPSAQAITHSEEHLVIETSVAERSRVGDCWYGIPRHICPTVALYAQTVVVQSGKACGRWPIDARNRRMRF
jgi:D-serine deaminase-like pyridoxal phosphate-dependent protein